MITERSFGWIILKMQFAKDKKKLMDLYPSSISTSSILIELFLASAFNWRFLYNYLPRTTHFI